MTMSLAHAYDGLHTELKRYRQLEEGLRQQIAVRSAALKLEETSIRKELDGMLIKQEMLQCEHTCLEAILRTDRVWVINYQAWYIFAVKTSRAASMERMGQNAWVTQEIVRLQAEVDSLERAGDQWCDEQKKKLTDEDLSAIQMNLDRIETVRKASDRYALHSENVLKNLETNAQIGRERYNRSMDQVGKAVVALRGGIVAMRNYLREVHQAAVANEFIVWAEAVGRIARNKARWDFQNPLCPLDLVILEGLRLRLADLI